METVVAEVLHSGCPHTERHSRSGEGAHEGAAAEAALQSAVARALLVTEALEEWAEELGACVRWGAGSALRKKAAVLLPCLTAQLEETVRWLRDEVTRSADDGHNNGGATVTAADLEERCHRFQAFVTRVHL